MRRRTPKGFSLIELAIVVAIVGVLASVAVPRLSRAIEGTGDAAFAAEVVALRKAIEMYGSDHEGRFPTTADIKHQLTKYTDLAGNVSTSKRPPFIYGPYLTDFPKAKVNGAGTGGQVAAAPGSNVAWVYNESTGDIRANTGTATDARGKLYSDY